MIYMLFSFSQMVCAAQRLNIHEVITTLVLVPLLMKVTISLRNKTLNKMSTTVCRVKKSDLKTLLDTCLFGILFLSMVNSTQLLGIS